MADLTAQRTLVKSPPELWSELSEVETLARHLGELGEIRITKVEPETTVAWEGEHISGTVELEQSGWGTKVTFHATVPDADPDPDPAPEPLPVPAPAPQAEREPTPGPEPTTEPVAEPQPEPDRDSRPKRQGFLARWLFRQRQPVEPAAVEPEPVEPAAVEPEPVEPAAVEPETATVVEPEPVAAEPEPVVVAEPELTAAAGSDVERVQAVLDGTLEALGQAHHRPFSRG